jgi:hypothetical protein
MKNNRSRVAHGGYFAAVFMAVLAVASVLPTRSAHAGGKAPQLNDFCESPASQSKFEAQVVSTECVAAQLLDACNQKGYSGYTEFDSSTACMAFPEEGVKCVTKMSVECNRY